MYIMIKTTLWFDDVGDVSSLLQLYLVWLKGHTCSQESGAGDIWERGYEGTIFRLIG